MQRNTEPKSTFNHPFPKQDDLSVRVRGVHDPNRTSRNLDYWIENSDRTARSYPLLDDLARLRELRSFRDYMRSVDGDRSKVVEERLPRLEAWERALGVPVQDYEFTPNEQKRLDWYERAVDTDVDEEGIARDGEGNEVIMEPFPSDAWDRRAIWLNPPRYKIAPPPTGMLDDTWGKNKGYRLG